MEEISQSNHKYLTIDRKNKVNLDEHGNEIDLRVHPNVMELYLKP